MLVKILNKIKAFYYFYFSRKIKLYKYKNFNEYKKIQIAANLKKENQVWATEKSLENISKMLKKKYRP